MVQILKTALAAFVSTSLVAAAAQAQTATADDTAKFLAGLRPAADSPLAPLTQDRTWQAHAERFNSAFARVDSRQLQPVRAWSRAKLTSPSPVLFYFFSGPDFLYANSFFPNATTIVMAGLEPPGPVPDVAGMPRGAVGASLGNLSSSLSSILNFSFFQTKDMRRQFQATRLSGTLPVLYVFMARSGKTLRDVSRIRLNEDGTVESADAPGGSPHAAQGAKIVYSGDDGREKTLYYFGTNVAGTGFKQSGLAAFADRLGSGDAFVKSASYLLHGGDFADIRSFILTHARTLVQDDTGVPVVFLDQNKWQLRPFGHYIGPISLFAHNYQSAAAKLFSHAEPMDFGLGYHWRNPNLLVASRTDTSDMPVANAAPAPVVAVKPVPVPTAKPAPIVTAQPAPVAPATHEQATTPEMLADAPTDEAPVRKTMPRVTRVIEEPATAQTSTARKRWAAHRDDTDKASAAVPATKKKHFASARANHRQLAATHKVHAKQKAVRTARAHHRQYAQQPYFFFFPTWR
jgi:hypothetical protein